jgi:hypothetical protein
MELRRLSAIYRVRLGDGSFTGSYQMEKYRNVTHSSNNDVDRALAACGALPMPYRNFEVSGHDHASSPTISTTCEFPLLHDALPQVSQVPVSPATSESPVAEDPAPVPEVLAPARRGFISEVVTEKSVAAQPGQPKSSRRSLRSVFRTLNAAGPVGGNQGAAARGLQDIFSRL